MNLPIRFFVPGLPKGQPRTRAVKRGSHVGVYDPGTSAPWKAMVMFSARESVGGGTPAPIDWPVFVDCLWIFPRPKSHFTRSGDFKPSAPIWYAAKPDRDNLDKAVLDAMVDCRVLRDDCIVVGGTLGKLYVRSPCDATGVHVVIRHAEVLS